MRPFVAGVDDLVDAVCPPRHRELAGLVEEQAATVVRQSGPLPFRADRYGYCAASSTSDAVDNSR